MNKIQTHFSARAYKIILGSSLVLLGVTSLDGLQTQQASAASTDAIYSYTLDGTTSSIPNAAATTVQANLNLHGTWSPSVKGVKFFGNLVDAQSVGYAKPTNGPTLSATASHAVGAAVKYTYAAPLTAKCADTNNVTQIGRFGDGLTQFKIQLSKCTNNTNTTFPECRAAGLSSKTSTTAPVRSTRALVDGHSYITKCYKTPDLSGSTQIVVITTDISDPLAPSEWTDRFTMPATGSMSSSAYLSVANKYPLAAITANTDQFVGDIAKVSFCKSTSESAVAMCLDQENPLPVTSTTK